MSGISKRKKRKGFQRRHPPEEEDRKGKLFLKEKETSN